ncbi:MAG: glycine zipper 2TM domain-containing protein [Panacagrimonas sp.]
MNTLALPTFVVASLVAVPAFAGKDSYYGGSRDDRYEPPRYEAPHNRYSAATEYADVISAQPIYRDVRIEEPRRECWDERVVVRDNPREREDYWFNNGAAGSVVGAIAGGVAGHQFGKGRGKHAATALGAIIGAGIGQRVALENYPRGGRDDGRGYEQVGYEERCRTVSNYRVEQRIEGYDVSYRYGGRTYRTNMPYDPGRRIPVDVNVQPVRY